MIHEDVTDPAAGTGEVDGARLPRPEGGAKDALLTIGVGPPPPQPGLDVLCAILPADGLERAAGILTGEDLRTLAHLARQGTGRNTLRALVSDLRYIEAWSLVATGAALPWPASEALALKFIAHHLYDPVERERDAAHGMPAEVAARLESEGSLRSNGPHAPATVRRRLALWSTLHRWKGLDAPFGAPAVRNALRLAVRAAQRPRTRKSARPVTRDILDRLLATCSSESFTDARDKALLLVAFASGGRRRSEVAKMRVSDLVERDRVTVKDAQGATVRMRATAVRLGRTKTGSVDEDERVLLVGRSAVALSQWLALSGISRGPVFRSIDRFGRLGEKALDPQSVNAIVKKRARMAGLDPTLFSAHGLRSGFMTEAGRRGVPLQAAMQQSRHRSVQQAASYYNETEIERSEAVHLG